MIITEISPQKKKGRYNIFVDGEFYSGLDDETIIKNSLKVGTEIDKQDLEDMVLQSEERSAFEKLINIISRQLYTKFELKQKLEKYGFNKIAIERAIDKAENYGYVNDETYAKSFINSKKNKSKLELKSMMFKKGLNSNLISSSVESISMEEEKQNALVLAQKYLKNKEINQKNLANMYAYLTRKGFTQDLISYVLRKFKCDDFED